MRIIIFYSLFLLTFLNANFYSQAIWFNSPTNNQLITDNLYEDQIRVNLQYDRSLTTIPIGGLAHYIVFNYEEGEINTRYANIYSSYNIPPGTHTWTLKLFELFLGESGFRQTASASVTFTTKFSIIIKNDFEGGILIVDGSSTQSGTTVLKEINETINLQAVNQTYNGVNYFWNNSGYNNSNWSRES